jgi:hypothetical protein
MYGLLPSGVDAESEQASVVDCDVDQNFNHLRDLLPWIDPPFRGYVEHGGYDGRQLPNYPRVHPGGFMMGDAVPAAGGVPGSDYETLREQSLDRHDSEYPVLTGEDMLNVSAMAHPDLAAALATAAGASMRSPGDERAPARYVTKRWLATDAHAVEMVGSARRARSSACPGDNHVMSVRNATSRVRIHLTEHASICSPFASGRSRTRTWDLFLIREAL